MTRLATLLTAASLVLVGAGAAGAQSTACGDRESIVKLLSQRHSEATVAIGLASNGGILEVLSTVDGTTWTLIMTMPGGQSCLMAAEVSVGP